MITLKNVQDLKVRSRMMLDQSNEIANKFENLVTLIENEIVSGGSDAHSMFTTTLLLN
jgi:hypothetical protein